MEAAIWIIALMEISRTIMNIGEVIVGISERKRRDKMYDAVMDGIIHCDVSTEEIEKATLDFLRGMEDDGK